MNTARMQVVSRIKVALENDRVIPVIGAGVSCAAARLPTWHGLIVEHGVAWLKEAHAPTNQIREVKRLAKSPATYPQAAQLLTELLQPQSFAHWLDHTFGRASIVPAGRRLLDAIGALNCRSVATTNYDKVLLQALLRHGYERTATWRSPELMLDGLAGGRRILHLHGVYDEPNSVVFGDASYRALLASQSYKMVLESLWMRDTLLFIGCSPDGLRDPDFRRFLDLSSQFFPYVWHTHYALVHSGAYSDRMAQELLETCNVHLVSYGDTHDDLVPFLEALRPAPAIVNLPVDYLPLRPSGEFVGRSSECDHVRKGLRRPEERLVSVSGPAGIGKTRLVSEVVASIAKDDSVCDHVVWVRLTDLVSGQSPLQKLLNGVAIVCHERSLIDLPEDEKVLAIDAVLAKRVVLLVLDDIDTVHDLRLSAWLSHLPAPSKALLISKDVITDTWGITLRCLNSHDALALTQAKARSFGISADQLSPEQAARIARGLQGHPLLITKALQMISAGVTVEQVLQEFCGVQFPAHNVQRVLNHVHGRAWASLSSDSRKALLAVSLFAQRAPRQAVAYVTNLSHVRADAALTELLRHQLVRPAPDQTGDIIIDPLVTGFTHAQRVAVGTTGRALTRRWVRYHIDFAKRCIEANPPPAGGTGMAYWVSLSGGDKLAIDARWPSIRKVLAHLVSSPGDADRDDEALVTLVNLLVHYMFRRSLFSDRVECARRAAEAAQRLERKLDAALLRIDALGWLLIEAARPESAAQEIRRGLQLVDEANPDTQDTRDVRALGHAYLARALLHLGRFAEAQAEIGSIRFDNLSPIIAHRVALVEGELFYGMGAYDPAIESFMRAKAYIDQYARNSDDLQGDDDVHYRIGMCHLRLGRAQEAQAEFTRISGIDDQNMTFEAALGTYGLAQLALQADNHDDAVRHARAARAVFAALGISFRLMDELDQFLLRLGTEAASPSHRIPERQSMRVATA